MIASVPSKPKFIRNKNIAISSQKYPWWEDPQDMKRFLQVCEERSRYSTAFLLALSTGMRLGEIVGLTKSAVDFGKGRIFVVQQWLEKQKEYGPTKNNLQRYIDFDPRSSTGQALRKAIEASGDPEVIFVTANGRRMLNSSLHDAFDRMVKRAGVPNISFHGLRHTYASWYLLKKDDIGRLQALLGHTDRRTTERYLHQSKRHRNETIDILDDVVFDSKNNVEVFYARETSAG